MCCCVDDGVTICSPPDGCGPGAAAAAELTTAFRLLAVRARSGRTILARAWWVSGAVSDLGDRGGPKRGWLSPGLDTLREGAMKKLHRFALAVSIARLLLVVAALGGGRTAAASPVESIAYQNCWVQWDLGLVWCDIWAKAADGSG